MIINEKEKNIIEGAKTWLVDNPDASDNALQIIFLKTLEDEGYLEKLKSPMTNKNYSEETKVEISNNDYKVVYGNEKEKCSK